MNAHKINHTTCVKRMGVYFITTHFKKLRFNLDGVQLKTSYALIYFK